MTGRVGVRAALGPEAALSQGPGPPQLGDVPRGKNEARGSPAAGVAQWPARGCVCVLLLRLGGAPAESELVMGLRS